jgi:hypothetical protein
MDSQTLSDRRVLEQVHAARTRAARMDRTSPRAETARYEAATGLLRMRLTNGAEVSLPTRLVTGLEGVSPRVLRSVAIGPWGLGLRWERLDLDLSVTALLQLCFGGRALLRAAGAAGGSARSAAKARAARVNGRKGGRPPRRGVA